MSKRDLEGKTFLVTGANAGIGKATATALAARGGSVVLASRSEEKTLPVLAEIKAAHEGADVHFLKLDLADLAATRRAAEEFLASGRALDVLINNAGLAATPGLTKDGFEMTIGTNHLGPFLFTSLLLPKLREAPQGRIVNVSSKAHIGAKGIELESARREATGASERIRLYGVSKLMNVLHANELARRLGDTKITTYSLHPGVVASDVWRNVPRFVQPIMKLFMITNEKGAQTSLYCATSPELAKVTSRYYDRSREAKMNPIAEDPKVARELWEFSENAVAEALAPAKAA
ncbi:SDR family oxidoreductase [soil metagenome]